MRSAWVGCVFLCLLAGCEGQARLPCDPQNDARCCGPERTACQTQHAVPLCVQGVCGRSDCDAGWQDLLADVDPATSGCETPASAGVPTSGLIMAVPSSGTSLLQRAQSNASYRNEALLAEPTPAPVGGAVEQTDGQYVNRPGFSAGRE